jgi:hypothetical protein
VHGIIGLKLDLQVWRQQAGDAHRALHGRRRAHHVGVGGARALEHVGGCLLRGQAPDLLADLHQRLLHLLPGAAQLEGEGGGMEAVGRRSGAVLGNIHAELMT